MTDVPRAFPLLCGSTLLFILLAGCSKPIQPSDLSQMPSVGGVVSATGTVEPSVRAVVSAPGTGILRAVVARDQMRVTSGQVLAILRNDDVVLRQETAERKLEVLLRRRRRLVDQARTPRAVVSASPARAGEVQAAVADLRYAGIQLQLSRKALRDRTDLHAAVAAAQQSEAAAQQTAEISLAQVKSVETQLPIEEDRYRSVKRLYESQAISRDELRTAEERREAVVSAVNTARAVYNRDLLALQSARYGVATARKRLDDASDLKAAVLGAEARYEQSAAGYRRALEPVQAAVSPAAPSPDVEALDSDIVQAQADLISARQEVRGLSIIAPIKGYVDGWQADAGQYVQGGQALGYVINLDRLKVEADVRPAVGLYLSPGNPVNIVLAGPPKRQVTGRVVGISPIVDPQTGTQKITVSFDNPGHDILPGTVVTIEAEASADRTSAASHRKTP